MVGADPSFTETHILRTLFSLDSEPTGRKSLVKILGVGEGSVRTIIKRLTAKGLVTSSQAGHALTAPGKRVVHDKLKLMTKPIPIESGLVSGIQSLVLVHSASEKVGDGVKLRDVALKAGADGAVILVYDKGLVFPKSGLDLSDYPPAKEALSRLNLAEGDVLVIGFAKTQPLAEDGTLAAALELV
ncbi:MAG: DUF4443 domain-containing protein [Candidatus Altiarchaeota archaeon]